MRAIEKDPGRRFQTAREFLGDIHALIGPQAAAAHSDTTPVPDAKPLKTFTPSPGGKTTDPTLRQALDRALASSRNRSDALENVLKGMIATRRRNYDEARDAYLSAMHELSAINNEVEFAKTALKYATMVLQKSADGHRDRSELRDAVNRLNQALRVFHEYNLHEQYAHAEYMINALERTAIGIIF